MSHQMGGGSVLVWVAFVWYGKSLLAILSGRQTDKMYCNTLEQYLVPFIADYLQQNENVEFQQGNVHFYCALATKNWLRYSFTQRLVWPARLTDLNP